MDKKEVLEQLVKGLKAIKEDMAKDLVAETTKKVNTPAAMGALKAKAASNNAAAKPEPALPPSNEATKKVFKSAGDEKTTEDTVPEKTVKDAKPAAKKKGLAPFLLAKKAKKEEK